MKKDEDFGSKFKVDDNIDFIVEEKNNSYVALRKVSWFESEPKLEIRKWVSKPDGDIPMKGCSITDEGANELVRSLISLGYGDTDTILEMIRMRDDFNESNKKVLTKPMIRLDDKEVPFYNPNDLF